MVKKVVCPNCKKKHPLGTTWCNKCAADIDESTDKVVDVKKAKSNIPRLFIYVSGGVIQNIVADQKIDVMVLDADVEGMDGPDIRTFQDSINGEKFEARIAWDKVKVDKKVINSYFKQR